jgi:hypothetical protein
LTVFSFSTLASTLGRTIVAVTDLQALDFIEFVGGDDGARTRDLCRDSSVPGRN